MCKNQSRAQSYCMDVRFTYWCEIQQTSSEVVNLPVETFNSYENIHKKNDDRCLHHWGGVSHEFKSQVSAFACVCFTSHYC